MEEIKENRKPTLAGWKIIFQFIFLYKREMLYLGTLGIVAALANALTPYLVGKFFDSLITPSTTNFLGTDVPLWALVISVWIAIQTILVFINWSSDVRSRQLTSQMNVDYMVRAVQKLNMLPVAFLKENQQGEVWNKIDRANDWLINIVNQVILSITPPFLTMAVGFFFLYSIYPPIALLFMVGVGTYAFSLYRIVSPITILSTKSRDAWSKAYGIAWDAIVNFQTVKQSTAEQFEKQKVTQGMQSAVPPQYEVDRVWTRVSLSQHTSILAGQLMVFVWGVFLIQNGTITIGELITINGYTAIIFGPLVRLGHNWRALHNGVISVEGAEEILQIKPENFESEHKTKIQNISGEIEFKHVHFAYKEGDPEVLKGINFHVEPGQVVALVGESGVGKSTTMELISGYYFPQKGAVLIDGNDTKDVDLYSLRKHIAIVPQEVVLFNDTIETNIRYGRPEATTEEVHEAAKKAHADLFINEFPEKYNQLVGERGIKLSVGQKQRIALARAMLRNPAILVLDEPTSALDAKTEKFIETSLQKLMKGRTTFIIAHRLSTVRRADKILVFEKGKIVEEGTHEELLLKKGVYERLYSLHVGLS